MVASSEPEQEWSIREYREGDEAQILELRGIVLSGRRDLSWWKWMYRDGPDGPALVMIAEAKQRIIGSMAVILVPLKVGDQVTRGSHGIDLMVHPDYRRLGIMKRLGTKLNETYAGMRRSISYGTPNDESHQGFVNRLNAVDVGEVPWLFKVIDWGTLLKSRYRIPSFAGKMFGYAWERITNRLPSPKDAEIKVEEVFSFDERIDKFWQKASKMKNIMVVKDMKYLNWRYVAKPGNEYKILIAKKQQEIVGYIVLKLEKNALSRGYIVDLLTIPGEGKVAEALITRAAKYFKEEGAATISCLMLQDTLYYAILRKLGFIHRRGPYLCVRILDPNIPKEFATNPANWYYVVGDGDSL